MHANEGVRVLDAEGKATVAKTEGRKSRYSSFLFQRAPA